MITTRARSIAMATSIAYERWNPEEAAERTIEAFCDESLYDGIGRTPDIDPISGVAWCVDGDGSNAYISVPWGSRLDEPEGWINYDGDEVTRS